MASRKKAEICIIGGGITGLALASILEKSGRDYILIESQGEFGGLTRGQKEKEVWLDYGLKSIPVTGEISKNPLVKLKNFLDLQIGIESWNESPTTLTPSGLGAFMGFGEAKNRFLVEELSYYTQTPRLTVAGGWQNLINELVARIPEERRMLKTFVTKIETKDDVVTSLILNGETPFVADKYIFTLSPLSLREFLAANAVTPKTLQRIARTTPLTAVSIDVANSSSVTDAKNLFVLQENSKEKNADPFFVIGQFISNVDPSRQTPLSTWMTFVDPESLEDDENASKTIKSMKKLIKKAFPKLLEEKLWERLLVIPSALGQFEQMSLENNLTLPGLSNLWIASGRNPGNDRNLGAALESAFLVSENISLDKSLKSLEVNSESQESRDLAKDSQSSLL